MSGNAPSIDCGPFLSEANIERELDMWCEEIREDAREEVRKEVRDKERERIVGNLLKEKLPLSLIARVTSLTEPEILTIADSLGVTIH